MSRTVSKPARVEDLIKPGLIGTYAAADHLRAQFDLYNEAILYFRRPVDFVFIGDSITQGWDVHTYFGGKTVVNRGIGGDITPHILRRFPADVLQLNPDYVVIKCGINNTWALDHPLNPPTQEHVDRIRNDIVGDIRKMAELSIEKGIRPVLCSILPTRSCTNRNADLRNELVVDINRELRETAAEKGAIYVDYHSHMTDADGRTLRRELADDGLHPNLAGYNIMADVLRRTLKDHQVEI